MIQAKVVADSLSPQGHRLTTLEVIMPRYILAEFNTHRILSKNSASSRAIPFNKMVKNVQENPFIPYAWQKDHSGMQGSEYIEDEILIAVMKDFWIQARNSAIKSANTLNSNKVTKQLANRLLEPFMYHKVLVSGTEWENFFNLRCPQYKVYAGPKDTNEYLCKGRSWKDFMKCNNGLAGDFDTTDVIERLKLNKGQADIHMMFLAEAIYDAINESMPIPLEKGDWHIPYGDNMENACYDYFIQAGEMDTYYLTEEDKRKVSIARCARLSYQTLGDNPVIDYEKDLELYKTLSTSGHWSPFEHVARVMDEEEYFLYIKGKCNQGLSGEYDVPNNNQGWCRNYRGFIQYREILESGL